MKMIKRRDLFAEMMRGVDDMAAHRKGQQSPLSDRVEDKPEIKTQDTGDSADQAGRKIP
jgi:hypothetical protein